MIGPRAKAALIMAIFALPIAASILAYRLYRPDATSNYGELLLPPATVTAQPFATESGKPFAFGELAGRWVLVASDSGDCAAPCREKLESLRQVRLALGRNASRVARVFVVDDLRRPAAGALDEFSGTLVALTPAGMVLPTGAANDRAHVYLVDPRGNVMMRWPAAPQMRGMLKDLERLLKASQIG